MTEESQRTDGRPGLLEVSGEIDIASSDDLVERATALLADGADVLEIDLGAVTFIDSSGLGALVRIRNDATARGATVVLVNLSAATVRLFEISGLDQAFDIRSGG